MKTKSSMTADLPTLTIEEFAFFEIGVRIRQCDLRHRYVLGWDDVIKGPEAGSRNRALHDLLWGSSYQLKFLSLGSRRTIDEHIAGFQACAEDEAERCRTEQVDGSLAISTLNELAEFLRANARYLAPLQRHEQWFELGVCLPAVREVRKQIKWDDEEELTRLEAELGFHRAKIDTTKPTKDIRKVLSVDWYPSNRKCWAQIEMQIGVMRRSAKQQPVIAAEINQDQPLATTASVVEEMSPTLTVSNRAPAVVPANHARDKWFYEQALAGKSYSAIKAEHIKLASQPGWEIVDNVSSIRAAISRYINRNELPSLPPRKRPNRKP